MRQVPSRLMQFIKKAISQSLSLREMNTRDICTADIAKGDNFVISCLLYFSPSLFWASLLGYNLLPQG